MIRDVRSSNRRKQRKAIRSRAWLNGEEVTSRCFFADDRRGIVKLYRLNAEGRFYVERPYFEHWNVPPHLRPCVATEELHGRVRIGRAA